MHSRRQDRRAEGFTLMEALVVVAIIAITAALAAPALSRTMADRRGNEATHALVRLSARARAEAMVYGRAMVLSYADSSSNGSDGSIELWRGNIDRCSANNWAALITADCSSDRRCSDALDMGSYALSSHRVQMRLDGANSALICYQPDGDTFIATTGGFQTTPPAGTGAIRFTFQRFENGTATGVLREVVLPFGGTGRIVR